MYVTKCSETDPISEFQSRTQNNPGGLISGVLFVWGVDRGCLCGGRRVSRERVFGEFKVFDWLESGNRLFDWREERDCRNRWCAGSHRRLGCRVEGLPHLYPDLGVDGDRKNNVVERQKWCLTETPYNRYYEQLQLRKVL